MFEQLIILFIVTILFNFFLRKYNFLLDKKYFFDHKSIVSKNKKIPLSGGVIFFITLFFFEGLNNLLIIASFFILLIGILSDFNYLISPGKRLVCQAMIVIIFLNTSNINIVDLRLNYLNILLTNKYFSVVFTSFCLLILINGTNFIDGINNSVLGYYLFISLGLLYLADRYHFKIDQLMLVYFCGILSILYIFNSINKLYLGDSGAYLVSFVFGIVLIKFSLENSNISPYFIMSLLWYPALENIFSIIRKKIQNKKFYKPDGAHLHQLLYLYVKKKKIVPKIFLNTFTGFLINFYNIIFFLIIVNYPFFTKFLIFACFFNIVLYTSFYFWLKKTINV